MFSFFNDILVVAMACFVSILFVCDGTICVACFVFVFACVGHLCFF